MKNIIKKLEIKNILKLSLLFIIFLIISECTKPDKGGGDNNSVTQGGGDDQKQGGGDDQKQGGGDDQKQGGGDDQKQGGSEEEEEEEEEEENNDTVSDEDYNSILTSLNSLIKKQADEFWEENQSKENQSKLNLETREEFSQRIRNEQKEQKEQKEDISYIKLQEMYKKYMSEKVLKNTVEILIMSKEFRANILKLNTEEFIKELNNILELGEQDDKKFENSKRYVSIMTIIESKYQGAADIKTLMNELKTILEKKSQNEEIRKLEFQKKVIDFFNDKREIQIDNTVDFSKQCFKIDDFMVLKYLLIPNGLELFNKVINPEEEKGISDDEYNKVLQSVKAFIPKVAISYNSWRYSAFIKNKEYNNNTSAAEINDANKKDYSTRLNKAYNKMIEGKDKEHLVYYLRGSILSYDQTEFIKVFNNLIKARRRNILEEKISDDQKRYRDILKTIDAKLPGSKKNFIRIMNGIDNFFLTKEFTYFKKTKEYPNVEMLLTDELAQIFSKIRPPKIDKVKKYYEQDLEILDFMMFKYLLLPKGKELLDNNISRIKNNIY
ncbi:MAG: hypothetical protein GY830_09955 [Bacteroidetes bacterium]|nr:hypothetical protein [Bacteroidota bacterium]